MRIDKMPISKIVTNRIKINRVKDYMRGLLNDKLAEIPAGTVEHLQINCVQDI